MLPNNLPSFLPVQSLQNALHILVFSNPYFFSKKEPKGSKASAQLTGHASGVVYTVTDWLDQ